VCVCVCVSVGTLMREHALDDLANSALLFLTCDFCVAVVNPLDVKTTFAFVYRVLNVLLML